MSAGYFGHDRLSGRAMTSAVWGADWDDRFAGRACVICGALGGGDSDHWIHVADSSCTEVYLDRGSQIAGYCIVVWRLGHVAEPTQLEPEAAAGYGREVLAAGQAVISAFGPVKVNYFTLGNTVPHLHTHVVPRYLGDAAPGGPLAWSQVVAARVFTEADLRSQASALRQAGLGADSQS
jgi:diadenosine tetraphosphate (Ap4A) HIT family hydrolase